MIHIIGNSPALIINGIEYFVVKSRNYNDHIGTHIRSICDGCDFNDTKKYNCNLALSNKYCDLSNDVVYKSKKSIRKYKLKKLFDE